MKFSINLNDEQSQHFAQLIRGEEPQEPVTQTEMTQFFATCVRSALSLDPDYHGGDLQEIGDAVLEDINRGGWSLIGQPPSTKTIKRRH
jgi:hypothetical protein